MSPIPPFTVLTIHPAHDNLSCPPSAMLRIRYHPLPRACQGLRVSIPNIRISRSGSATIDPGRETQLVLTTLAHLSLHTPPILTLSHLLHHITASLDFGLN